MGLVTPKFCKKYAAVGTVISQALVDFREEVANGEFPGPDHTPYTLPEDDKAT
eukprot:gene4256-5240_t